MTTEAMAGTHDKKRAVSVWIVWVALLAMVALCVYLTGMESSRVSEPEIERLTRAERIQIVRKPLRDLNISTHLMLVNGDATVVAAFTPELTSAYRKIPLSRSDIEVETVTLQAVQDLFAAAKSQGYPQFLVCSGFRSFERQGEIYEEAQDKGYVQRPGASEHQTGLAVDIAYTGISNEQLGAVPEGRWVMDNAWRYGLILRYPSDKVEDTGIQFEPWHYRYVGLPHAYYCHQNNLCLEEYLSELEHTGGFAVTLDETSYTVYYAKEDGGVLAVPAEGDYEIASDNRGGYIITIKA